MSDLKKRIKAVDDIQKEVVHVDEWDVDIEVRGMDGEARAEYFELSYDKDGKPVHGVVTINAIIATCYDVESGEKLFDAGDAEWLRKKCGAALGQLYLVAFDLSGLAKDEMDKIKNALGVEESDGSTSP